MDQEPVAFRRMDLLEKVRVEWDQAEHDIKLAEQVCQTVVIPSVNELRYAGRRIIELIKVVLADGEETRAAALLQDACFDCHRARHDAIDASVSKITLDIEVMLEKLGHDVVLGNFAELPKLLSMIDDVQKRIVLSRKDRTNREAIYAVLESTDFPGLIGLVKQLQISEPVLVAIAKSARRSKLRNDIFGYVGIFGLIITIILWAVPPEKMIALMSFLPNSRPATAPPSVAPVTAIVPLRPPSTGAETASPPETATTTGTRATHPK